MYKVLLVDDEKIIRIALKSMIRWEEQGFCVCASAADGHHALDLLKEYHPHLIIVDIMMPKMDGLEFIKLARLHNYNGEFIILSNHENFQYAVEALHHGVLDYLLKTDISPESLIAILNKVKQKLDAHIDILHQQTMEVSAEGIELTQLCQLAECNDFNHIEETVFLHPWLFVDIFLRSRIIRRQQENNIPPNTLKNLVLEVMQNASYPVIQYAEDALLILIPQNQRVSFISMLPLLSEKIQKLVRLYMNTDCGFVCSQAFQSSLEFINKRKFLPQIEQLVFFYGFETIIQEEFLTCHMEQETDISYMQKQIRQYITEENYEDCKHYLYTELSSLKDKKPQVSTMLHTINKVYTFLIFDYSTYLEESQMDLQSIAISHNTACTFQEYIESLYALIDLIQEKKITLRTVSSRKEILLIDQFIRENLNKKLSLSMIAEHINMSENYLSRLFKAETGNNIINYINLQKMELAKDLLANPETSIKEIALLLGYDEPSYFNKLFNKFYNINPSDYRKKVST